MCLSRNKKNNAYPCKPQFYYIKVGFKGVKIIQACFRDEIRTRFPLSQSQKSFLSFFFFFFFLFLSLVLLYRKTVGIKGNRTK